VGLLDGVDQVVEPNRVHQANGRCHASTLS